MRLESDQRQQVVRDSTDSVMVAFHDALSQRNLNMLRQLLSNELDPNTFEQHGDKDPEHILLSAMSFSTAHAPSLEVLLEAGADPCLARPAGGKDTLLMLAIYRKRMDFAQLLIQAGADVNAASSGGWRPVHAAAAEGKVEFLQLLDRHGANFDVITGLGATPLMLGAGDLEVTRFLLPKLSHRINHRQNSGMTALLFAIEAANMSCVNLMLGADADPSIGDGLHKNAEEFARHRSSEAVADQVAMVRAAREAKALIESLRTSIGARPAA